MDFTDYLTELNKIRILAVDEERRLWRQYKDKGDLAARARLIEAYQPLVFKQALPFRGGENIMDIIQEGTVGLIEAAENYDYRTNVAFSLYAMHRIRGRMLNFVEKESRQAAVCLDEAAGNEPSLKDSLPDTDPAVADQAERSELMERVRAALNRLPMRERAVLQSVYLDSAAVSEVAAEMELSASYIYRLQKSGLRRIRGMMARFMKHW